jgi:uncharacterized membrane protein YphA (DoxX/SURF4 family)
MTGLVRLGQVLLGVGMIALGGMGIAYADFIMEWTQVPEHLPAHAAFAYVHGVVLVAAGLAFVVGKAIRLAALALGTVWLLWTLLCIPLVFATWRGRSGLEAELLGMTCGIFTLAALVPPMNRTLVLVCRYAFALCLPVYGMVHFLIPAGVASWIPRWIPGPAFFWAYFTGVAHCAAGVALLTGVLARLATKLFAIMLSSWVLILHIPRVAATPHDRHEWLTLFIALSLSGVAWIMAGSLEVVPEKRIS